MPALTKAEKLARKEAKKLEKLRVEEEMRKQMRRDELTREMAVQARKRTEIDKTWRETMSRIKEPTFKQEVEIVKNTFERALDKKNNLMHHYLKLIDTAESQHLRGFTSFCTTMDTNINKFLSDLEELSAENDRKTKKLIEVGDALRNKLMEDHNTSELKLQLLLHQGLTSADNDYWEKKGEYFVKEDDKRTTYLAIRDELISFLESHSVKLWDEYKFVLKSYVTNTASNQKNVRRLRRKDNVLADIIARQKKSLATNDLTVARLRNELAMYEGGSKQAMFRYRRDKYRAATFSLKHRLTNGQAVDDDRLKTLVQSSNELMDWLKTIHEKGSKICRLAALCRKFETLKEKVLPFNDANLTDSEKAVAIQNEKKSSAVTSGRKESSDESLMSTSIEASREHLKLWCRMSHAELSKQALLREKAALEQENAELARALENNKRNTLKLNGSNCGFRKIGADKREILIPTAINGALEMAKYEKFF